MNQNCLRIFALFVVALPVLCGQQGLDCGVTACPSQSTISETPQGIIDGHNAVFSIEWPPTAQTQFALFRNGLPLRLGRDYQISGQLLKIVPAQVPVSGDALTVLYTPAAFKRSASSASLHSPNSTAAGHSDEITLAAAREELNAEITRGATDHFQSLPTPPGTARTFPSSLPMPASFRMLVTQTKRLNGGGTGQRDAQLQGLEGLGDEPLYRSRSSSQADLSDEGSAFSFPKEQGIGSQPGTDLPSIRMLEQRISAEDDLSHRETVAPAVRYSSGKPLPSESPSSKSPAIRLLEHRIGSVREMSAQKSMMNIDKEEPGLSSEGGSFLSSSPAIRMLQQKTTSSDNEQRSTDSASPPL